MRKLSKRAKRLAHKKLPGRCTRCGKRRWVEHAPTAGTRGLCPLCFRLDHALHTQPTPGCPSCDRAGSPKHPTFTCIIHTGPTPGTKE